jgi:predicted nuclease of predicted toxin-antitoxin system
VKLLFDQNISDRLVDRLNDIYPSSQHVRQIGLATADDADVWACAARDGRVIVSKDSDFRQRSFLLGQPPKVVWIALGNCSTQQIEALPRDRRSQLEQFAGDPAAAFLVLC